jgi:t-SNARE complex subunit (syntaxin)
MGDLSKDIISVREQINEILSISKASSTNSEESTTTITNTTVNAINDLDTRLQAQLQAQLESLTSELTALTSKLSTDITSGITSGVTSNVKSELAPELSSQIVAKFSSDLTNLTNVLKEELKVTQENISAEITTSNQHSETHLNSLVASINETQISVTTSLKDGAADTASTLRPVSPFPTKSLYVVAD